MRIVADDHIHYVREYFEALGELACLPGREMRPQDVIDADVLLVRSITRVNASLLLNSSVKFVGSVTAGTDHLDLPWLKNKGITVASADGFNAPAVADYVVSVVAAMQKRHCLMAPQKKAAVIGVGRVGSLVADCLALLGFTVTLCDPPRKVREPSFNSTLLRDIQDMDLVTLHVPLTHVGDDKTVRLLDDAFFHKQNTGCVFINASRGPVVATEVLLRAAKTTHLCLDVFEHEPLVSRELLEAAVIATPHIAGYSVQSKLRGTDMIYREMVEQGLAPERAMPISMPQQTLSFAGEQHSWCDVVLGVFNPHLMTTLMREKILFSDNGAHAFEQLRNTFAYRHEFAYTRLSQVNLTGDDLRIIKQLKLL